MIAGNLPEDYIGTPLGQSLDLLDSYEVGDYVRARVVKVDAEFVYINIGLKEDEKIPRSEFDNEVKENDEIEVKIVGKGEDKGRFIVSYKEVIEDKKWEQITKAFQEGKYIKGKVIKEVRGGLKVDLGVKVEAFLPASLISLKKIENLTQFIGQEIMCKIIELDRETERIIISRKDVEKEEEDKKEEEIIKSFSEGTKVKGKVVSIMDYGVFVDIGGVKGLIHKSELAWRKIDNPTEVVTLGEEIEVLIMQIDLRAKRIALSLKRVEENPWDRIDNYFKIGQIVKGQIVKILKYGIIVQFHPDFAGLVHISELPEDFTTSNLSVSYKVGDEIEAKIVDINKKEKKISLSVKETINKKNEQAKKYIAEEGKAHLKVGEYLKFPFESK